MPSWTVDPDGTHGEVFTRRWVVDLILDLAGYRAAEDLGASVIVEPACGAGAFLGPIVERLAESCARYGRSLAAMGQAIRAFDVLDRNVDAARESVAARLVELGQPAAVAASLSSQWVSRGDFLLGDGGGDSSLQADFVVGNPPYVRLEDVPAEVSAAYRSECSTMRGRADIYVGFFEKGLSMLGPEGRLAFICADRWMHNQYGERLRVPVASEYAVDAVVVMHDVDAFEDAVSAYPAITVLRNGRQGRAHVVEAMETDSTRRTVAPSPNGLPMAAMSLLAKAASTLRGSIDGSAAAASGHLDRPRDWSCYRIWRSASIRLRTGVPAPVSGSGWRPAVTTSSSSRTRRTSSPVACCQYWPHKTSRRARRSGADGSS